MQSRNKLKSNILYNLAYQVLVLFVPLITAPYVSRKLGVNGMGEYQFTYSIAYYFALFSMLGVLNYGNREIASARDNKLEIESKFWEIFTVQFLMGSICLIVYYAYCVFFLNGMHQIVSLAQGVYVIAGLLDISWFYFGIEKFKFTTSISAVIKIVTTVLVFVFIKNSLDVWVYAIIIGGGELLNKVMFWFFLKENISFRRLFFRHWKQHMRPLILLFIPVIAVSLYKYMDKIMLGYMMSTSEVGIYEAAEKFINLPTCVIAAVGTVMLPRITNLISNSEVSSVRKYNYISMGLVLFLGCGMSFGLRGISSVFIPWFYGEEFARSSEVLNVLLPSILFVSWANVIRTQCLLPNKRDMEFCASVICGAIVNLVINYICIPQLGAMGAAIGTLISETTVCIIQSIACRRDMEYKLYLEAGIPFLICGTVMFVLINQISFKDAVYVVIARILCGVVLYVALSSYFVIRVVKKYQEWS